tara:strand:+ start:1681 stop:1962 length:282 start_codon:yes stop_codon:yes gene_type:complete
MMRFKNVKHAEYEIINAILRNPNSDNFNVSIHRVRERGIPEGDVVAEKRFTSAAANIIKVLRNMQGSRLSSLPEGHADYGLELKDLIGRKELV